MSEVVSCKNQFYFDGINVVKLLKGVISAFITHAYVVAEWGL